jgi:hypothetical protein
MRYLIVLLLAGCVTTSDVYLADGSKGINISCGGGVQNFSACLQKAGEICGTSGYSVVNREGDAVPFSVASANASANRQAAQGTYVSTSGTAVTRNLFVRCNQDKAP